MLSALLAKILLEHKAKHLQNASSGTIQPHFDIIKIIIVESCDVRSLKAGFLQFLRMNNSATEHDTTELITPFHSESTVHSNDINISYYQKLP